MQRQLTITCEPIHEAELVRQRSMAANMGAAVYFTGVVRAQEAGQPIRALEYEAFVPMAEHQFELIFQKIEAQWPIDSVRLVHRVGVVPVNEASLWVEVLAPHRAQAFAACQFLIDELKRTVPIWKKPVTEERPGQRGMD